MKDDLGHSIEPRRHAQVGAATFCQRLATCALLTAPTPKRTVAGVLRTTENGFVHVEPLWGSKPIELIEEFIDRGHRARMVGIFMNYARREWLGREFTKDFMLELAGTPDVDICEERGECTGTRLRIEGIARRQLDERSEVARVTAQPASAP